MTVPPPTPSKPLPSPARTPTPTPTAMRAGGMLASCLVGAGSSVHTASVDPFLVLGLVVSYILKARRREGMAQFAARYGFEYTPHAPSGLLAYGFPLFFKGDGWGAENGVIGEWKGLPFKAADFWYYTESTDSKGNRSK